jgi:hypothetical protein
MDMATNLGTNADREMDIDMAIPIVPDHEKPGS